MTEIAATTNAGTGVMLPIGKAVGHLMTVYAGSTRNNTERGSTWAMTPAEAANELDEAYEHIRTINLPTGVCTDETNIAIAEWVDSMSMLRPPYRSTTVEQIANMPAVTLRHLRARITESWTLLTLIDRELLGLNLNATDPGRTP